MDNTCVRIQENDEVLYLTGFNDALIGISNYYGSSRVAVYSIEKCIDILIKKHHLNYDLALEHFYINIYGSYFGDKTPILVETFC